ncbi:MAG: DNA methyltransferase [bacterium JZ-2024 1]
MAKSEMQNLSDRPGHPGEKLREGGAEALSDSELLAILIGTGMKGKSAEEIAREFLKRYGSVEGLVARLKYGEPIKGIGTVKRTRLLSALELGRRVMRTAKGEGIPGASSILRQHDNVLELFPNVQFIYELALAELELEALGAKYEVTNGLRVFNLLECPDWETLRKRVAYFQKVCNAYTDYDHITRKNRMRSVNQYLTHWIYPYKGKFHPQMIRALLNIIALKPGDTVLDPFIGSGTTAVEAQLLGVNCVGYDISPLCVIQSRVKTLCFPHIGEIEARKNDFLAHTVPTLRVHDAESLSQYTRSIAEDRVREFYLLAQLLGHSDRERRGRDYLSSVAKNVERMLLSVKDQNAVFRQLDLTPGKVKIERADARSLPLGDCSVDGIITSPPYSIALDYVQNDAHALKALGWDVTASRDRFIGVRGRGAERIALYNEDMKRCYSEMYRVLKPGKHCVIVVGNATFGGEEIKTVEFTIDYCQKMGFTVHQVIDKIIFGLYNVMQAEKIIILTKNTTDARR